MQTATNHYNRLDDSIQAIRTLTSLLALSIETDGLNGGRDACGLSVLYESQCAVLETSSDALREEWKARENADAKARVREGKPSRPDSTFAGLRADALARRMAGDPPLSVVPGEAEASGDKPAAAGGEGE